MQMPPEIGKMAHEVIAALIANRLTIATAESCTGGLIAGALTSVPGSSEAVYGGFVDKFPLGAFMEKGLTLKTGQTHVQHYMPGLLNAILEDKIDTTFLISHTLPLEEAPKGYKMFHDNQNEVTKVVLKPGLALAAE